MFIQDRSVSTGMFSKAGRFTVEMYTLLQEKEYIMTGQKKQFQQYENQTLSKKNLSLPQLNSHNTNIQQQLSNKNQKIIPREDQPFFKSISRDYMNKLDEKKVNNGKFGMYEAKHHYIYGNSPLYEDQEFLIENKKRTQQFREKIFSQNKHNLKTLKSILSHRKLKYQQDSMMSYQATQRQLGKSQIQQQNSNTNILDNSQQFHGYSTVQNQPNNLEQTMLTQVNNQSSVLNNSIISIDSLLYGIDYDKQRRKIKGHIIFDKKIPSQGIQPH